MRRVCPFLALLFALGTPAAELTPPPKTADLTELPLESLMNIEVPTVFSASKLEQKATEAPASVTIVTADEIKKFGYRTLADVLNSVQGFWVSYDRNYSFLGARGINLGDFNSRVLLLVDGHRVNNNLTDGAAIGNDFIIDLDLADRVEIVRGAGSVLYGNNAFFGVINVVTRKADQLNGVEISGEYGSFETWKARLSYGKAFRNGLNVVLSGSYYDSAGEENLFYPQYNTPDQNNGIAHGIDGENSGSIFGSVGFHDFTLEGAFNRREKENPTAQYFTTFNDSRLRTVDQRSYVNLKYAHDFLQDLAVTARVYYDQNDFEIGYPFGSSGATSFYKEQQYGQWWGAELQLNKPLWEKHLITLGADYRDDFQQSDLVYEPDNGQVFTDAQQTRLSYGIYAQADIAIITNLHLNGGVRYDQYGNFDPAVDPRLAVIYNPFEKSTLKAIYGTAFRAPNFLELSDPRYQNVSPEKITSYGLIYEQGIGRNLRSSLALFYNQMEDLIVFQSGQFTNLNARSEGVEVALEGTWAYGIRGRASYTFQNAENRTQDQGLSDSPEHLVKFNLSVPIIKEKLFAGLEFLYTSQRSTYFTTLNGDTLPGLDVTGFGVLNFTLFSQNLVKNLDLSASIYNLLDEQYADPATRFHLQDQIPQNGRSFRLKMTYRF
jgi:outer membrane receptor for ferrienterochelin and colicins